jgi:hypothetical protein
LLASKFDDQSEHSFQAPNRCRLSYKESIR